MNRTIPTQNATTEKTQEQTLKVENLIAEIQALTARIEKLRQHITISISRK